MSFSDMHNKGFRFNFNLVFVSATRKTIGKGKYDQNTNWNDAHKLDSCSENKNANVQNKSYLNDENSRYVEGILTKNN